MPTGRLIYVVDDDADICESCKMVLEHQGHAVKTFLDSPSGLKAIQAKRPDLLILDVMMEEADSGFQAAAKLAQEQPGLPIIMLTSLAAAAGQIFDTAHLPVAELVEKPIAPDDLVKKVSKLLARSQG
jgi:CheY-like chemotaxis protein